MHKMKPSVLLLSTYPIKHPLHGGQIRLANIAKAYANAGMRVSSVAVCDPGMYEHMGSADVIFPTDSYYREQYRPGVANDILGGRYAAADDGGFERIHQQLPDGIDVIHSEQPWLWPLAKKIKKIEKYQDAILVYGSQNIESPLRRKTLTDCFDIDATEIENITAVVKAIEMQAASEADIVVAVTQADLDELLSWGAKKIVLAKNGIAAWQAEEELLVQWKSRLPEAPWLLYIASAHPPNYTGFLDSIGNSLGCIPPDSKLVLVGQVCFPIKSQVSATRWNELNLSRLQFLFSLSDEDLAAVKTLAHAYLLPIQGGGGSNLKTAEALYSGAYVIGTKIAFRGFEDFANLQEVVVAETPAQMHKAIRHVLTSPAATTSEKTFREKLLWNNCLADMIKAVTSMLKERSIAV